MDHFQVFKRSQRPLKNSQIIKVSKGKNGVQKREPHTTDWHDWVDHWSRDLGYDNIKEIIGLKSEIDNVEEKWTGNYIFENEWQSLRTKQHRTLEFTSAPCVHEKPGKYRIMVKVVDIWGGYYSVIGSGDKVMPCNLLRN